MRLISNSHGFHKTMLMVLVVVTMLIIVTIFGSFSSKPSQKQSPQFVSDLAQTTVGIGGKYLKVHIANTSVTRSRGLSGYSSLGKDEAMLFVFAESGNYGFWMKDMNFSIDIAWFDANWQLVHLESDVAPETYPKVFGSEVISKYVLETEAGFFATNGIGLGLIMSVVGQ